MRTALPRDWVDSSPARPLSANPGLLYEVWAPTGDSGAVDPKSVRAWLDCIKAVPVPHDYERAYATWKHALEASHAVCIEIKAMSRLLIGHGNASPTEVGLTLHRTWGVPLIPGTALKGLLNHYIDIRYGPAPERRGAEPWKKGHPDAERARYQGVTWSGTRMLHGPGEVHRALFGAPAADSDDGEVSRATSGAVIYYDALLVPEDAETPLAPDILTVHQQSYYRSGGDTWPCDYDDPNPVAFLTVRPSSRFLLAVGGDPSWAQFAIQELKKALEQWGIGAKTSSGYGRLMPASESRQPRVSDAGQGRQRLSVGQRARWKVSEKKTKKGGAVFKIVGGEIEAILHSSEKPREFQPGEEFEGWIKADGTPVQITIEEPRAAPPVRTKPIPGRQRR